MKFLSLLSKYIEQPSPVKSPVPTITIPVSAKEFQVQNEGEYSPHLNIVDREDVFALIRAEAGPGKSFLDVGGRNGERRELADGFEYRILDIDPIGENSIRGDICHCPQVDNDTYDVVFSMNLLEHVDDPWAAATEMIRIARNGSLLVHLAPFAWRYHPFPEDYWRFSHTGLKMLFERSGCVNTILSGYDIKMRRKDHRGGTLPDQLDVPPIDQLGGWREHWHSIWVGRKVER